MENGPVAQLGERCACNAEVFLSDRTRSGPPYEKDVLRSLLKTISYRVLAALLTASVVLCITGEALTATYIGAGEFVVKAAMYFIHERIWSHIHFGNKQLD